MNLPQVYMCSPSWALLPPPSPYHPSGLSQCTSPKHPVSCIEPGLSTRFIHDILHVSMPFSQIFPPSPSPTESIRLFYTSVSLLLSIFFIVFFFFFKMYLFLVALGLHCWERPFSSCDAWELFSSCVKWGLLSSCDVQISHCGGFSCWGAWVLGTQASVAAGHGLSCSEARGVFPDQWWNPCLLDW